MLKLHAFIRSTQISRARVVVAVVAVAIVAIRVVVASAADLSVNDASVTVTAQNGVRAVPSVLAADEFSEDGPLRSTTTGGPWKQQGSVWSVASKSVAAAGASQAYLDLPGVVDGSLSVVLDTRLATGAGIFVRGDASNGIVVLYKRSLPSSQPELQLHIRNSGAPIMIPTTSVSVSASAVAPDSASLRVEITGRQLTAFWNGMTVLNYELSLEQVAQVSAPTNVRWGLWVNEGQSPRYSHFLVRGIVRS